MHRGRQVRRPAALEEFASLGRYPEGATHQGLRGCSAEAGDHFGLDHRNLRLQPRPAGIDLLRIRLLMDASLASLLPLEMLDGVRDVDFGPVEPRILQGAIEEL